ncbi:neuropeptide Y receptor type 5-like [Haliotis rufescens]|uniref:neuropeptide Y receptor type 5-like n=1 Tax=Haliotis rufescens TaxID=6454 RepID=UPI001EAFCC01|nr:neuropeptide Y receptor type 5-like [Haliotis rufescens]XP_046338092.1 neuropeptide Y receptor type 5-like [Haliotis rufescens]
MTTDPNSHLVRTWLSRNNDSSEVLRASTRDLLRPFACFFILVGVVGIISNIALVVILVRRRLHQQSVFQLVANLAVVEVVRCMIVLPLILTTVFVKDWRLGSLLCFVWPVLLPCTIHVTVFGLLALFVFRYLKIVHNAKSPIPAWTCNVTSWLLAIAILTPHAAFKRYIDLHPVLGSAFKGIGICVLRPGAEEKNKEYVLSIFFVFYVALFIAIMVLAVLVQVRIKSREREFPPETNSFSMEMNIRVSEKEDDEEDNLKYPNSAMLECEDLKSSDAFMLEKQSEECCKQTPEPLPQVDQPVTSKKTKLKEDTRMQKFLGYITVLFALLWLPFYIHYQIEALAGNEEPGNYVLYLSLLLIGYLASWSLPIMFSLWQVSKATKYKIKQSLSPLNWGTKSEK